MSINAAAHRSPAAPRPRAWWRSALPRAGRLTLRLALAGASLLALAGALAPAFAAPPLDTRFGIAEGFRNPNAMADTGAGWERIIVPWDQVQPDGPGDFTHLGLTLGRDRIQAELNRGTKVAGVFQFTPGWAQSNPDQGRRSPPRNLDLPIDDPNNYFARFVSQTVQYYAGQIDQWVIWNEPEFKPGDAGSGGSFTWLGTDEQFARLLKVGYLAVKRANPNATVGFAGTSYWVDVVNGRPQYYDRLLSILDQDPDAAANNDYHDVTALNLYRAPDDIYRVYSIFKGIQHSHGIDKPLWLTETNAMPSDDRSIPCADQQAQQAFVKTSMDQQAAYAVQAFALGAAAGYGEVEFYQMVDANPCLEPAVWGVTRDDGTKRPVEDALRTAISAFSGYTSARFVPLTREDTSICPCWPDDPTALVTNNQLYQVAFDKPGNQRVTALWNGDADPLTARIPKNGTSARVVDRNGAVTPLQDSQGWWTVSLPGATAYFFVNSSLRDPDGYHYIGGDPLLIVEDGVDPSAPVAPPALGAPGSSPRDFHLTLNPEGGQTVPGGSPADFFLSSRGLEGFSDPIQLSVTQWSSQRFPNAQDPSTLPLQLSLPAAINPGDTAQVHVETAGADPGIYYIDLQASGGGVTRSVELSLVLN